MTTTHQQDVVDLLHAQHEQIKALFADVKRAAGSERQESFHKLVRLLAVHETAEEEVVHPVARTRAGEQVVEARLQEEDEAKQALADLYDLGVDSPGFEQRFGALESSVLAHAEHEERDEFPHLREGTDRQQLVRMAGAVQAAESMAPTRPHPAAGETAMANLLAGPPLAMFDRARDALRDWRQSHER
jgi:hemerythrin superfamily protein